MSTSNHPIRLATDLESNCKYQNFKYVVQVQNTAEGWVDSKHGGNTIDEAVKSARLLLANDDAWITDKRTPIRIVKSK